MQLTPVLSDFPSIFQDQILCALFRVPDADQLGIIGLAHLLRGNHSISHDDWERLDVTIALSTTGISTSQKTACNFTQVGDRFQNIAIISVIPNMVKAGYRG